MGCGCGQKKVISQSSVQMEQQRLADQRIAQERAAVSASAQKK